ncbi:hypothetical protein GTGU_03525 [Trabulsiella guamensis ATCC 49490]|uniref:Uncharacterized protein n=1 Tax=Trabulsiella guamensis ATCC 49490 TaxID=1005994 RepID=A0A084ZU63_9ENTR|nr:hypothetical protein GTGU_03525 [Trabulsiella guamensis ATCC 49490]
MPLSGLFFTVTAIFIVCRFHCSEFVASLYNNGYSSNQDEKY